jgi:hypothetical protein
LVRQPMGAVDGSAAEAFNMTLKGEPLHGA